MAPSKTAKRRIVPGTTKKAPEEKLKQSYLGFRLAFSFRKYDANAPWTETEDGKPTVDSVFANLRGLEGLTWNELRNASGARCHGTNHHYISQDHWSPVAVERAKEIRLLENELFSLHLQGTMRLFGVIEQENGTFYVIWFDPNHKVCPISK